MNMLQQQFIDKIAVEYESYMKSLYQLTHDELIEQAQQIADMQYIYGAFVENYVTPTHEQLECLISLEKPLETIVDTIATVDLCGLNDDLNDYLWEMVDHQDIDCNICSEMEEDMEVER